MKTQRETCWACREPEATITELEKLKQDIEKRIAHYKGDTLESKLDAMRQRFPRMYIHFRGARTHNGKHECEYLIENPPKEKPDWDAMVTMILDIRCAHQEVSFTVVL